jgi:hypothetical protein
MILGLGCYLVLVLSYCEGGTDLLHSSGVQERAPFSLSISIMVNGTAYQCNAQISDIVAGCGSASFQVSVSPFEYQLLKDDSRARYFSYAACLCIPLRYSIVDFLVSAFILYRFLR